MIKVSIVILNWNKAKLTVECLKSVRQLRVGGYELSVVVVDNASVNNSARILRKGIKSIRGTTGIKWDVLANDENLGYAGGNNVGIEYAIKKGADFVIVLNNDTLVEKDFATELLKAAKKFPKAGAFSPKIYFAKGFEFHKKRYKAAELGKVIWAAGGAMDWDNVFGINRGVDKVDKGQYKKSELVDFASGAAVMYRTKVLKEVGIFDEKYFMYMEDVDLCMRMNAKGHSTVFVPKSLVWHKVAQSSAIGSELNDYYIARNRLRFGIMYAPLRSKVALIKESWKLAFYGRKWEKIGVADFYLGRYGRGSWR